MTFGIIGLGKMGSAIAQRVFSAGYAVIGYDPNEQTRATVHAEGITIVDTAAQVVRDARVIWLMVPAGAVVDAVIAELTPHLREGDILIDGGNSLFTDSARRASELAAKNIIFLDCGTSGGVHGREYGFSLMVGGNKAAYEKIYDVLKAIAAPDGVGHVGPSGAGHYVKMVHNGIEYGLLQAYGEGLELLREGSFKDTNLDLPEITRIWNHGAVIRSFILELTHDIVTRDPALRDVSGEVGELGTGRWAADDANTHNVPMPVLDAALHAREQSRLTGGTYATKIVAMLRNAFGGHVVKRLK